jgi:hypothetical protein
MRLIRRAAVLATALASVLFITAAPASAAASRRSGDACTHNWDGPQVCISIKGHDDWVDRLTVTWTDPGKDVQRSTAILHEGDQQTEVHIRQIGRRQDGQIVAEWTGIRLAWGKVCGSYTDTPRVWACVDVHTGGPWSS